MTTDVCMILFCVCSKLDFSVIPTMEVNDLYSHIGVLCGLLPEVYLFKIDDVQLTFLFKDWLKIAINRGNNFCVDLFVSYRYVFSRFARNCI